MTGNAVFRRHVDEHAAEPIIGRRGDEVRRNPELRAAECSRDRVAAKGNRIIACDGLVVAGRNLIDYESYIDVALTDKECLHFHLPAVAQACRNAVDCEMYGLNHTFVRIPRSIAL